jgi:multiple sugar transport system substrate-binding protein
MKSLLLFLFVILCISVINTPTANAQNRLTFWTTEVERDRIEIQREIALAFASKIGILVQVVPVGENHLAERVTAAYAARSLPDVIYHPVEFTIGWTEAGILDDRTATEAVNRLGIETFCRGPLKLIRVPAGYASVPIDGWGQLLLFRKDLFEKAGLPVPRNWHQILQTSKALHNPPLLWGFEAATDPGQIYTQQVFEHFALSNGVRLTGTSTTIDLDNSRMVEVLEFYKTLARFTPPGNISWLNTRLDYLSGRTAMIVWSPFILDELSGLRPDQPVVPDITRGEPGFLARNTGFVSIIEGPNGAAQYGQINCLGITRDADKTAAQHWVEFLLTDGYLKWLSMAAEGKLPLRKGTRNSPNRFTDGWMELEFGGTTRAKISQFYGMDVAKSIMAGLEGFDRWGFAEGKGTLISKIYRTKVIPEILKQFLNNEMGPREAARMMDKRVKALE